MDRSSPASLIRTDVEFCVDDEYSAAGTDQQELVDRYPGLAGKTDDELIELVGRPPAGVALMGDVDEATAVAAILLERRLFGRGGAGAKAGVAAGAAGR